MTTLTRVPIHRTIVPVFLRRSAFWSLFLINTHILRFRLRCGRLRSKCVCIVIVTFVAPIKYTNNNQSCPSGGHLLNWLAIGFVLLCEMVPPPVSDLSQKMIFECGEAIQVSFSIEDSLACMCVYVCARGWRTSNMMDFCIHRIFPLGFFLIMFDLFQLFFGCNLTWHRI